MLNIENVTKSFGSFTALENANVKVENGSIHGLIGENGAGKTTLVKCAVGIYKPTKGKITLDDEEVFDNPKAKMQIGYVGDRNTAFGMYTCKGVMGFYKDMYKDFDTVRFNELNEVFNLDLKKRVFQLSKGMQMRLALMLNMSIHPKLLVLDEPTDGLDPIAKKDFEAMLIDMVAKEETAVLISSHQLSELERLCDSLSLIQGGNIYYQNSVEGFKGNVKKLQLVLKSPVDFSNIKGLLHEDRIGSISYIIVESPEDSLENQLREMGADIVEEIGMSLEDIFVYSAKARR